MQQTPTTWSSVMKQPLVIITWVGVVILSWNGLFTPTSKALDNIPAGVVISGIATLLLASFLWLAVSLLAYSLAIAAHKIVSLFR